MGSERRERRQKRVREFGRRHPWLTLATVCAALAGVIAICAVQLTHGAYLGRSWAIAALAGMATAVVLGAAVLINRRRRYHPVLDRVELPWLVLGLMSASAIRFTFPVGPYGSVQALFNVVHAALLGYEAVTCTVIVALLAYITIRRRRRPAGRAMLQQPAVRAAGRARARRAPDRSRLPARLRFPSAESATWRAGHLIAANSTVRWLSL